MRRRAALLGLLVALAGHGQNVRSGGYAFEQPRLLTQQLIFGLDHGIRLLADACAGSAQAAQVAAAHEAWRMRHGDRVRSAVSDLARHYFGTATESTVAVAAAMGLKPALAVSAEELAAACESFAQALQSRRYDLDLFFALRRDAARVERADAVRSSVRNCRASLSPAGQRRLDAAFLGWQQVNGALADVARKRYQALRGDAPADRLWRIDAGGGAVPPAVPCKDLAAALAAADHDLRHVFEDEPH